MGENELPGDWTAWRDQVDLDRYDQRWAAMEAAGQNPHGEADLVHALDPGSVLDGGCGTGRVAIELARRGLTVVGVDPDADMIDAARAKAPEIQWVHSGLESLDLGRRFDVVVLAGNVIPYASERAGVVAGCALHLEGGGSLVAGFQLRPGWPTLDEYDAWCDDAGLELADRWATWSRDPYDGGAYAVSRHRRRARPQASDPV